MIKLFFLCLAISPLMASQPALQQRLINQAIQVQSLERDLLRVEKVSDTVVGQEKEAYRDLSAHQHQMVMAIQNMKVWQDFSPAFMAISSASMTDLVHSYMVLERLIPKLNEKNQEIFPIVKKIVSIHKNSRDAVGYKKDLQHAYENALVLLGQLLDERNKTRPLTKNKNAIPYKNIDELITTLDKISPATMASSGHEETALLTPVVGDLCPPNPKNVHAITFQTRPDSLVISPWGGTVIYAEPVDTYGHVVVIQQDSFYAVVWGLGTTYCQAGEKILVNEPIGRMPSLMKLGAQKAEASRPALSLQLYKNALPLDPTPYLKHTVS